MSLSLYSISKKEMTILKGIGMVSIVLHNFIHKTTLIGENEFDFMSIRIVRLYNAIIEDPGFIINGFFSFFGHYGVQIFIFISGYGLAKQFLNKKPKNYFSYVVPRLLKIYVLLGFALLCYILIMYPLKYIHPAVFIEFFKSTLLLYNNFSSETIFLYPNAGPLWYFGLIIELYILFPLFYYIFEKYKIKGFYITLFVVYILTYILHPVIQDIGIPFYPHFLGHLPEFLLAMAFAMFKDIRLDYKTSLPLALIIFALSCYSPYFFPLSFLTVTILIFMLIYPLCKKISGKPEKIMLFLGGISMFMFIINGPLRTYTIKYAEGKNIYEILLVALIHLFITIILSYLASIIYNKLINPIVNRITSYIKN